jgi:hypothetical protein
MNLIPIKVECHSGYKADEYPRCFYLENTRFEIKEISDRWYQSRTTLEWPIADYFKVYTASNAIYLIKHELKSDLWFLVEPDELMIRLSYN